KSTKEDKEKIKEIMGQDAHLIDDMPPREMYRVLKEARADIMLSGGRSQFVALKAKMPWLDINQERHYAYAGYEGMVDLVREIDKALSNPIWQQVRTPAPWDEVTWEQRADEVNIREHEIASKAPSPQPSPARGEGAGRARGEDVPYSTALEEAARSPLPSRERGRGEGDFATGTARHVATLLPPNESAAIPSAQAA
ncbi:MAG: nitrogenase component 1, partial [Rhodomicrobium sp.]